MLLRLQILRHWLGAHLGRLHREDQGQAMTEYAVMSAYLLVAGLVSAPFVMRFAPEMLNALQIYMDGFYFSLALPLP